MEKVKKKNDAAYWIWVVVGLFFMFAFGHICPTWSAVTPMGVTVIGIFIGLLLLITTTGELIWPSLAALVAVVVNGYMGGADAIKALLGSTTILQVIVIMVLCAAIRDTGAGQVLAKKLITMKFVQGRPLALTMVLLVGFLFADIFLDSFGGILFGFTVLDSIREMTGYKKNDKYIQAMTVGIYLCGMIGAALIPFTPMTLAITGAFGAAVAEAGIVFSPSFYIISAICVGVCFMIVYSLLIKFVFRCDMSKMADLKVDEIEAFRDTSTKFNSKQIIFLLAFVVGVAYAFVCEFIPQDTALYAFLKPISLPVWFCFVIFVLAMIKIKGEPLMNCVRFFKEGPSWPMILTIGMFMIVGSALSSNDLGVKTWLLELLGPLFSNVPFPVFIFLIVAICAVVTNFFSNMATGVIVSGIVAPFVVVFASQGFNPSVIAAAIAYSSMFAFMTYAAAGPAPLLLGKEGIENKFIWTKGLITLVAYIIIASVVFSLMGFIL